MQRLIGVPCLAHRLFHHGYKHRLGFSYWEREHNELTNALFAEFPPTQLHCVTTFEEILDILLNTQFERKTLIQVIRNGLDSVCHYHREKTDVPYMLTQLQQSIEQIVEALSHCPKTVRVFVTADHGILWFNEQTLVPVAKEHAKPRYAEGIYEHIPTSFLLREQGKTYTVLTGDNALIRKRKATEWGFHGGVSAQESFVPFFEICPNM